MNSSQDETGQLNLLRAFRKILFSANIASAFVYASLLYISKSQGFRTPQTDSTYYFLRSAYRINDLLHLPSRNSVSTSTGVREFPSRWSNTGDELLILMTTLGLAALILFFVTLLNRQAAHRVLFKRVAGVTALFAAPALYLFALKLTWSWSFASTWPVHLSFWKSIPFIAFTSEALCLGVLVYVFRKRVVPVWAQSAFLFLHYAFWILVLRHEEIGISIYSLYAPYLLLALFPLSGIVWLLYLKASQAPAADNGICTGLATMAVSLLIFVLTAFTVAFVLWVPRKGMLADAKDLRSLTVELSRGPCYGSCPVYTVTIHGNGVVEYLGKRNVKVIGLQTETIGPEDVIQVLRLLDRAHFSTLEDRAFTWCFDSASVGVSASVDGRTKQVASDDYCTGSGAQLQFVRTTAEIDRIVQSNRWVKPEAH